MEGRWVQNKRMYDTGWSDEREVWRRRQGRRHGETQVRNQSQRVWGTGNTRQKRRRRTGNGKEALRRIFSAEAIGGNVVKHKSCDMPVGGFQNHAATDGSLLCVSGRWGACGWSVVQLDHDEEMRPMHAGLEVQRTIKMAGLAAFLVSLQKGCRSYNSS